MAAKIALQKQRGTAGDDSDVSDKSASLKRSGFRRTGATAILRKLSVAKKNEYKRHL